MNGLVGIVTVPFETLVTYHPQFALAVLSGVEVRPNTRSVQGVFSSFALNVPMEESFDHQITGYSVFAGAAVTLDPTEAFNGNLFKYLNDRLQADVTGITCDLLVRSRDEHDYAPIPDQTPLQMLPGILNPSAGIWAMNSPDNVKLRYTLTATPPGDGPLTVWTIFSFLVLGEGSQQWLCMSPLQARTKLREYGYGPSCPPPAGGAGASVSP